MAGTPRGAGPSGKKKGPEIVRALVYGGGTRNRTRVRFQNQIVTRWPSGRGFDDLARRSTIVGRKPRASCSSGEPSIQKTLSKLATRHCRLENSVLL